MNDFLHRHGVRMEWHCRRSFLRWFVTPVIVAVLLLLLPFALPSQSSRFVYIFQSMFTSRGGPHPWGDSGPRPPPNYTGAWRRWHWNGRPSFEEHYANGKLDGPFKAWDSSGRNWLDTAYRAGRYHGHYILFYHNGVTNIVKEFFDGQAIGHWLRFYADGKKRRERFFSAPDVPDASVVSHK